MTDTTKKAIFLYDFTGLMAQPWLDAGYECWLFDGQHEPGVKREGNLVKVGAWFEHDKTIRQAADIALMVGHGVEMVFGFPECTDLTVAGAKHWVKKGEKNHKFQAEALSLALMVGEVGKACGSKWAFENPIGALRDKHELTLKDLTERLTESNRLNFCMDELSAFAAFSSTVIDQLEAERQQREAAEAAALAMRDDMRLAREELAELRGEQEPVTMDDLRDAVAEMSGGLPMEWRETTSKGHQGVPFINFNSLHRIVSKFTRQPKPVVVKLPAALMPAIHNSGELFMTPDNLEQGGYLNRDDVTLVLRAAGIVVKDGE